MDRYQQEQDDQDLSSFTKAQSDEGERPSKANETAHPHPRPVTKLLSPSSKPSSPLCCVRPGLGSANPISGGRLQGRGGSRGRAWLPLLASCCQAPSTTARAPPGLHFDHTAAEPTVRPFQLPRICSIGPPPRGGSQSLLWTQGQLLFLRSWA